MSVPAVAVATALRERLPGLPTKKLHKLLYYCQGHHLATFGEPLFEETVSAWDMGPVVGQLWYSEDRAGVVRQAGALGEGELNTIGYVVSRYGRLTGHDLEHLTHSETPWQTADTSRTPHDSVRIELEWLTEYFSADGAPETADEQPLDPEQVSAWLKDAQARRERAAAPDTREQLSARLVPRA